MPLLKGDFNEVHANDLMFGSLIVLDAIRSVIEFAIKRADRKPMLDIVTNFQSKLMEHNRSMAIPDFKPANRN